MAPKEKHRKTQEKLWAVSTPGSGKCQSLTLEPNYEWHSNLAGDRVHLPDL